jgi:DNA polymerase-1
MTILVLDAHYLCHRAFHAQGKLSWKNQATGVVFGFLQSIISLKEQFRTDHIAFCFEGKNLYRKKIYPAYKARRYVTSEDQDQRRELALQIDRLRDEYLPAIGFKNIFCMNGYESDDIMANLAYWSWNNRPHTEEIVLVTADSDLYQCIRPNVSVWSPQKGKMFTWQSFEREFGISPCSWSLVKAISGCASDNVKGVGGIGEVTALKYLRGELPTKSKAYQKIMSGAETVIRNKKLVLLPFDGCPKPLIVPDDISEKAWTRVCDHLGMRSLAGRAPILQKTKAYERA